MRNLVSFSMLHNRVESLKNELNLDNIGQAFDRIILKIIFKMNDDEIEDSITDGSNDCGIDAVYIEDDIVHICNCKYAYDIDQTEKNFPGSEIDKIISTITLMLSSSLSRNSVNEALWEKYVQIKSMFLTASIKKIVIHFLSNKEKPLLADRDKLEKALSRFKIISYKYYDLEDIITTLISAKPMKLTGKLMLLDDKHFEKNNGELKTIIGVVPADNYLQMLINKENPNHLLEDAFNDNIRLYKPKHSVNKAIVKSALSVNNYQFFYLNNGITIICEKCGYIPNIRNQVIEITNFQIINGGQTTHSLFEAYKKNPETVKQIDILVRICVANNNSDLAELISESTNNQIPVMTRDLKSNDFIQKKLEEDFINYGYFYERKSNQYSDVDTNKILSNELLAQIYMAYELGKPSEAKNNKSKIFNSLYEAIFDEEKISAEILLNLYNLYLPISKIKKDLLKMKRNNESISDEKAFISYAIYHILFAIKLIANREGLDIKKEESKQYLIDKGIKIIQGIVKEESSRDNEFTFDKFFKETNTNRIISSCIDSLYI